MSIAIDHVGIPAADPWASARFLGEILAEGEITPEGPDGEMVSLRAGAAMLTLPPQQHAVAVMRWLFGMKNSEIADELGIASGTVAAHVFAVRAKLRAALEQNA